MKVFQILVSALVLSTPTFAVPMDCMNGTLADFLAIGSEGCRAGGVVLSDFQLVDVTTGAMVVDASAVNVVVSGSLTLSNLNFQFAGLSAGAGEFFESAVGYTISRGGGISGLTLSLEGAAAAGSGAALAFLNTCAGGVFDNGCTGTEDTLAAFQVDGDGDLAASSLYDPTLSMLSIIQRISAEGGPDGSASLAGANLAISQIPEPGSLALAGAGIGLIWALGRRRRA